jgi:hypothetical protein
MNYIGQFWKPGERFRIQTRLYAIVKSKYRNVTKTIERKISIATIFANPGIFRTQIPPHSVKPDKHKSIFFT